MARSKLPVVLAIVFAVIIATYLTMQLRAERQSIAQLQERAATLELAQSSTAATLPAATLPADTVPEAPASASQSAATLPAAVAGTAPAPAVPRQQVIVMRPDGTRDPDPTAGARALIRMFYGDIEKDLGVTTEEMNALVQLTARGNATPAEIDAAIGGRYAQLQERTWEGLAGNRVQSLRSSLASSTHPLTEQQEQRLTAAWKAEFRRTDGENNALAKPTEPRALLDYEEQRIRITEASNERLIAAARTYVSAEQLAVLQSSMDSMLNSQRRNLQTRRLRVEAGGSGAADPPSTLYVYPAGTTPPGAPPR
jgi:hypothetical protein